MKTTRVYDLPTRLFHWSFAALFLGAFIIAKAIDDESPDYAYHMLLGLILALTVGLRIIWGIIGSRYARFSSFALKPSDLVQYSKQLLLGRTQPRLGHNPASAWAALIMMGLAIGLAVTGYVMTTGGNKEVVEEVHALLANVFIIVAIAHVAGVILHTLRHRDWIALSMVHGGKKPVDREAGIARSHAGVGLLYIATISAFVFHLNKNYDSGTQNLNLFGNTLHLGEAEGEDHDDDDDED